MTNVIMELALREFPYPRLFVIWGCICKLTNQSVRVSGTDLIPVLILIHKCDLITQSLCLNHLICEMSGARSLIHWQSFYLLYHTQP